MFIHRQGASIWVRTPAKLNLFFEVLARRSDGFHEIETLMAPINLCDTLVFCAQPDARVHLDCRWAGGPRDDSLGELPPAEKNLAYRAVELLRSRAGIQGGAQLQLLKRIPSAAGLGGGSSDAAAALAAANLGWNLNWPTERLAELAAELGSDVPFFLAGSAAVCRGRGEQIEAVDGLAGRHFVVVRPPEGLSTAAVYQRCRPVQQPASVVPLLAALVAGNLRRAAGLFYNALEHAAVQLSPLVERLAREFAALGCPAAQMSGSGSSYFALCHHAAHARQVAGRLRSRGLGHIWAVQSL